MAPGGISTTIGPCFPRSIGEGIDRGVVRREPDAFGVGEFIGDGEFVVIEAEVPLVPIRIDSNETAG